LPRWNKEYWQSLIDLLKENSCYSNSMKNTHSTTSNFLPKVRAILSR
jgi:hypothetical protein